jgi:hypothetical protein
MSIAKASPLFGKINVYPPDGGKQRVEIYIQINQKIENMKVGIAVDGSVSMRELYAANIPREERIPDANVMQPVVRGLCRFICDYSGDGTVQLIYWAVGDRGEEVEVVGRVDGVTSDTVSIEGPKEQKWGTGTRLLPPLNYFLSEFANAPWTVLLFITDGVIADLDAVIARAMEIGNEMVAGTRHSCKFVVVGIGEEVDEEQLEKLDNMFHNTPLEKKGVDLWDCRLATSMNELLEIWDEVDFEITLPGYARIADERGNEIVSYADGIPQRMEFDVVPGTESVTVEIVGQTIIQPLISS